MTAADRPHHITVALTGGQMATLETIVQDMHAKWPDLTVDDFINSLAGCAIADAAEELCLSVAGCPSE